MKKKSKKSKRRTAAHEAEFEFDREEVRDELLALQAIYGDDLILLDNNEGFTLHVVPHPGEAETNYVSLNLEIRYIVVLKLKP